MKTLFRFLDWPLRAKMAALLVVASLLPLGVATLINIRQARQRLLVNTTALLAARGDQLLRELDTFHRSYQRSVDRVAQMASGIAHDINNASSPVALYTESLLEQEPNLSERARDQLTAIQRAIEDVAQTVSHMREFYRQREPQLVLAPVQLNRTIEYIIDLTRARWNDVPQERGIVIRVQTALASDLPGIMGVESEIRDALAHCCRVVDF